MKILKRYITVIILLSPVIYAAHCEFGSLLFISTNDCVVSRFNAENTDCKAPCAIKFQNNSINAITSEWEIDGSNLHSTLKEKNPSFTFEKPGKYNVKLMAWRYHTDTLCIDTSEQIINIK